MMYTSRYDSPVGPLLLAGQDETLTGLWMEGQKYYSASPGEEARESKNLPVLQQAERWLDRYFAGKRPAPNELPLAPAGSAFQKEVWNMLLQIPYGEVVTYGALAKQLAARRGTAGMSPQAVGGAVGHNPISIIIPCHRVVGSNGSLTGYAGGLQRKVRLLTHEGVDMERLFVPRRGTAL